MKTTYLLLNMHKLHLWTSKKKFLHLKLISDNRQYFLFENILDTLIVQYNKFNDKKTFT